MGSSGSGSFTDYPGSGKNEADAAPEDRCKKALSSQLEDVEHHAYYTAHGKPPPIGTVLEVALVKRVVAVADGEIVGNLPTRLNYLAGCMRAGYEYVGIVTTSKSGPTVIVSGDFAPK